MSKTRNEYAKKRNVLSRAIKSTLKIVKQVFEIRSVPNPWQKSIGAGISTGAPMLIGLLANYPLWGSVGGLGSFVYLYFVSETYYRRAKKMFFVVIGFTLVVFLGTLAAPYPFLMILILGLIGATVTFLFGVLRYQGQQLYFSCLCT